MRTPRKCLAHYVDAAFDTTYAATDYQLLGKDLESMDVELNPQVETTRNILGENSVAFSGYEPTAAVDTFYHDATQALSEKVMELAMARKYGDECKTSYVEVLYKQGENDNAPPVPIRAFREDIILVPRTYGGDTNGVQVPFDIQFAGNRVPGTFDRETRKFTADGL